MRWKGSEVKLWSEVVVLKWVVIGCASLMLQEHQAELRPKATTTTNDKIAKTQGEAEYLRPVMMKLLSEVVGVVWRWNNASK
jgi:hypothetical protein